MKPFVVNRHGRLTFPATVLGELDFTMLQTLDQFAAVIGRDFEAKALPPRAPVRPCPPVRVREAFRVQPVLEALSVVRGELVCTNEDVIRNASVSWSPMSAAGISAKTGIDQRRYSERGMQQTHASVDLVAACAGLPYGLAEAVRLIQEVERPVLLVWVEKFSDKIGAVRTSRMIFGDGAAALVVAPGEHTDIEVLQTYASGPAGPPLTQPTTSDDVRVAFGE